MYTPFEEQLQGELSVVKDCYSQVYKELVEAQDEKLLEAQSNEYKDDFGLVGVRKHSNQPLHYYLQLKRGKENR